MKRKIEISVGSVSGALDRFEQAWHRGVARGKGTPEVRLTFENLPLLLKNLTPARWTLIEQLKRSGPLSINELARRLDRHYKNVRTDVTRLRLNSTLSGSFKSVAAAIAALEARPPRSASTVLSPKRDLIIETDSGAPSVRRAPHAGVAHRRERTLTSLKRTRAGSPWFWSPK